MRVFISWSGGRSHLVAAALHEWIQQILQAADPWMSTEDIGKGKRWNQEIAESLSGSNFGIVCLTPENLNAPWLLFEAGALAKNLVEARVCTYLFDLKSTDVKDPLAMFQATGADKEGTFRLVMDINAALPLERQLKEHMLEKLFESLWPKFAEELVRARPIPAPKSAHADRPDRELLEEVLLHVRSTRELRGTQILSMGTGTPIPRDLNDPRKMIAPGCLVKHPQFGYGRVLDIADIGPHTQIKIFFYVKGEKTLMLHLTSLEVAIEEERQKELRGSI